MCAHPGTLEQKSSAGEKKKMASTGEADGLALIQKGLQSLKDVNTPHVFVVMGASVSEGRFV